MDEERIARFAEKLVDVLTIARYEIQPIRLSAEGVTLDAFRAWDTWKVTVTMRDGLSHHINLVTDPIASANVRETVGRLIGTFGEIVLLAIKLNVDAKTFASVMERFLKD